MWSASGQDAAHKGTSYNLRLNPTQLQADRDQGLRALEIQIEVPPGAYRLRVVVRDNLTGQIGSVQASAGVEIKLSALGPRRVSRKALGRAGSVLVSGTVGFGTASAPGGASIGKTRTRREPLGLPGLRLFSAGRYRCPAPFVLSVFSSHSCP